MSTPGTLTILGTPIGNMGDLSPRAQAALSAATRIACEDTRRCGRLFQLLGLKAPPMVAYHKDNEHTRTPELIAHLQKGEPLLLMSDSGMPAISDPGAVLVNAAREGGLPVEMIPGATAVTTAIAGSGFGHTFTFGGFPPRKSADLTRTLQAMASATHTIVLYESPNRVQKTISVCLDVFGNRRAWVVRELTKLHEEWIGRTISEISASLASRSPLLGECIIVIEGLQKSAKDDVKEPLFDEKEVKKRLKKGEPVKSIALWLSSQTGLSKKESYARVQALKQ